MLHTSVFWYLSNIKQGIVKLFYILLKSWKFRFLVITYYLDESAKQEIQGISWHNVFFKPHAKVSDKYNS